MVDFAFIVENVSYHPECSPKPCVKGNVSKDKNLGAKKMSIEKTYGMIKPDGVRKGFTGKIIDRIEQEGFNIVAMKKIEFDKDLAELFYEVHREKPFFDELVENITAGPVVAMVLEKENAISAWRELMGSTNPDEAAENTLRKLYGENIGKNAVHGSDAPATAETEIKLIFPDLY